MTKVYCWFGESYARERITVLSDGTHSLPLLQRRVSTRTMRAQKDIPLQDALVDGQYKSTG